MNQNKQHFIENFTNLESIYLNQKLFKIFLKFMKKLKLFKMKLKVTKKNIKTFKKYKSILYKKTFK